MPKQISTKIAKVCCDRLLLAHSENFILLNFVIFNHNIFLARLCSALSPAVPGAAVFYDPFGYATACTCREQAFAGGIYTERSKSLRDSSEPENFPGSATARALLASH